MAQLEKNIDYRCKCGVEDKRDIPFDEVYLKCPKCGGLIDYPKQKAWLKAQ